MVGILTGCSLFFPNDSVDQASKGSNDISSSWLIAAQGQGGPPACVKALAPGQAKKLADKALKENVEVQALAQALKGRGKKLNTFKAHGCKVKGKAKGQGLSAMQTSGDEATLIEVPAGNDAALYLLENTEDGNEWVSLKEVSDIGETLVHLEVGLLEETAVAGLQTEGTVGQMSLVLPDDVGTQEVASDLQQLFSSQETTTAQEGVSALQAEGLDWAHAEVIVDQDSVVSYSDGTQELEAVVVIPEEGSTGQVLWGRTNPMLDVSRATFAKVTVKKTPPASGSTRPTLQVVSPPTQVKKGSELQFEPFDLCPYQHYGRVSPFTRPLCYQWEQKAAPKVQQVSFDRGVRTLPAVHAQSQQALQSTKGGVVGLTGSKGGLILAGIRNTTPEKLQQIYNNVTSLSLQSGSSIEGQQQGVFREALRRVLLGLGLSQSSVGFIMAVVGDLITILGDLGPQGNNLGQGMLNAATTAGATDVLTAIQNNLRDYYTNWKNGQADPGTPTAAVGELIDRLQQFFVKHGFSPSETALTDAIAMLANFIHAFTQAGLNDTMRSLVEKFGPYAVFIFDQLKKFNSLHIYSWYYAYPSSADACIRAHQEDPTKPLIEDSLLCFLWQINQLKEAGNIDQLMGYLAAMAYLVNHPASGQEESTGLEGIARVTLLVEEFLPRLLKNGWEGVRVEVGSDACDDICFFGIKQLASPGVEPCLAAPDGHIYCNLRLYGFVEPYLEIGDVDRVWQQIVRAANFMITWGTPSLMRNAVVQIIDNFVPTARDDLCRRVQSQSFWNTPVVVIGADGRIECWSPNSDANEALLICLQMGITGCHLPTADSSAPSSASASPPATLVVPLPTPTDPACKGKYCLI